MESGKDHIRYALASLSIISIHVQFKNHIIYYSNGTVPEDLPPAEEPKKSSEIKKKRSLKVIASKNKDQVSSKPMHATYWMLLYSNLNTFLFAHVQDEVKKPPPTKKKPKKKGEVRSED